MGVFINPRGEIIANLESGYINNSAKRVHNIKYINISKILEEFER